MPPATIEYIWMSEAGWAWDTSDGTLVNVLPAQCNQIQLEKSLFWLNKYLQSYQFSKLISTGSLKNTWDFLHNVVSLLFVI